MEDSIIQVENLGKKYRIQHQQERQKYTALRDVIAHKCKSLFQRNDHAQNGQHVPVEDFWALKNVSFEIKRGEVVGFIGRNGAGKSTLLKILSRITEPTEGRVRIKGRVASLLEVGTGFHPELTGRENIFLNGAILGMTKAEIRRKFDEIVAFSEVEKFLDTPVKRYSSGMYVRLAFAVAAHLEPEILIVDEVLAVGDGEFQKKCLGKMQDVSKNSGRTVLFVSHNMPAIQSLCSRGLVMLGGKVQFDGPTTRAIEAYSNCKTSTSGLSWTRPRGLARPIMAFESIDCVLSGRQPQIRMECDVTLETSETTAPVFVAVDVCDHIGTPLMQAIPATKPFISGSVGRRRVSVQIDLPPLIPGRYSLDFWIGSHFATTSDYVKSVVVFEITDSPSSDRSYPHSPNHGFLVPASRFTFSGSQAERPANS